MNIFFLDKDPRQAAEWMVDRHVVKMILETAQLLSTAHRVIDGMQVEVTYKTPDRVIDLPFEGRQEIRPGVVKKKKLWVLEDHRNDIFYNATHINHPSALWVRESVENYNWLVDHLFALGDEYRFRYGKTHATIKKLGYDIQSPPFGLKEWDWTTPKCAMPEEYIVPGDYVQSYRNYYKYGKSNLHKWSIRSIPEWIL